MIQPPAVLSIPEQHRTVRRIVFLGMNGVFSLLPFRALVEAGHDLAAVVIPGGETGWVEPSQTSGDLPLLESPVEPDLRHAAWVRGVPVLQVHRLQDAAALQALGDLRPDVICVACFPRLLPPAWLALPSEGCLNLHPSLLPAYRGPAPLFWQFRAGETETGVSLHFIDEGVDTGDIVAQSAVPFPDGVTTREAERYAAQAGGSLMAQTLASVVLDRRPQPTQGASYQSFPTEADREIPPHWTARRVFNFIRGAADWAPFWLAFGEDRIRVGHAYGWHEGTAVAAVDRKRRMITALFAGGVVEMRMV